MQSKHFGRLDHHFRGQRSVSAYFVIGALTFGLCALRSSAFAQDAVMSVSCPSQINQCGCTITKPGTYVVDASLSASQGLTAKHDCVDIKASNVTINLNGETVDGTGSPAGSAGVHILAGSNKDFIVGNFALLENWDVGLAIDANFSTTEDVDLNNNRVAGLKFTNAKNNVIEDFEADDNTTAGVWLKSSSNNLVLDYDTGSNGTYGIWMMASSNNQAGNGSSDNNLDTGVYIGCSATGPTDAKCKGVGPSKGNRVYDGGASTNTKYGVAIDLGDTGNIVGDMEGGSNGTDDALDNNANCDSNVWVSDSFPNANQSCIQ